MCHPWCREEWPARLMKPYVPDGVTTATDGYRHRRQRRRWRRDIAGTRTHARILRRPAVGHRRRLGTTCADQPGPWGVFLHPVRTPPPTPAPLIGDDATRFPTQVQRSRVRTCMLGWLSMVASTVVVAAAVVRYGESVVSTLPFHGISRSFTIARRPPRVNRLTVQCDTRRRVNGAATRVRTSQAIRRKWLCVYGRAAREERERERESEWERVSEWLNEWVREHATGDGRCVCVYGREGADAAESTKNKILYTNAHIYTISRAVCALWRTVVSRRRRDPTSSDADTTELPPCWPDCTPRRWRYAAPGWPTDGDLGPPLPIGASVIRGNPAEQRPSWRKKLTCRRTANRDPLGQRVA